ncbi:MAG: hypothetical protein WDW20_00905 [Neisseriaceae bacterium]
MEGRLLAAIAEVLSAKGKLLNVKGIPVAREERPKPSEVKPAEKEAKPVRLGFKRERDVKLLARDEFKGREEVKEAGTRTLLSKVLPNPRLGKALLKRGSEIVDRVNADNKEGTAPLRPLREALGTKELARGRRTLGKLLVSAPKLKLTKPEAATGKLLKAEAAGNDASEINDIRGIASNDGGKDNTGEIEADTRRLAFISLLLECISVSIAKLVNGAAREAATLTEAPAKAEGTLGTLNELEGKLNEARLKLVAAESEASPAEARLETSSPSSEIREEKMGASDTDETNPLSPGNAELKPIETTGAREAKSEEGHELRRLTATAEEIKGSMLLDPNVKLRLGKPPKLALASKLKLASVEKADPEDKLNSIEGSSMLAREEVSPTRLVPIVNEESANGIAELAGTTDKLSKSGRPMTALQDSASGSKLLETKLGESAEETAKAEFKEPKPKLIIAGPEAKLAAGREPSGAREGASKLEGILKLELIGADNN